MTEEEAKTKWCPKARSYDLGVSANRLSANGEPMKECFCIASKCMAWEWRVQPGEVSTNGWCEAFVERE